MNLTNARNIVIDGKIVQQISIDGNIVYASGPIIKLTADKSFILAPETVTITLTCEELPYTEIKLFSVINMTKTLLDTLTTDENGQATYTYEGTGAGNIGFVAVYDETDSNIVTIDDYTPVATSVGLTLSNNNVTYGTSVTLTATVKDKHDQNISSGTVTFKDGNTSIGTGSISNGVATLTKSNFDWGSHSLTAEINNIVSTAVTLNVNKLHTATTIVPPTLYYKDEFDVSGTLKDANGTGLVGETVTLLWNDGSDHTATATTTTDGAYTFHRDAPTSITEYSFKVIYAGTDNYNASETGTSTVTVNKELTVTAIISPTNGSTVSGDVVLTGTLLDDEGSPLDTSSSVVIAKQNPSFSEIGVATVGSDGSFSYTVPASSLNNVVTYLQAEYFSTTNYSHSFAVIVVYRAIYNGVALSKTAGKQILSYDDYSAQSNTEYCTVTAQLKNGNNNANISGVSVVFNKVDGSGNIISQLGTGTTDSNGQASYTYTSVGAGDVRIRADVGSFSSEIYELEDTLKYDSGTSDNTSKYDTTSASGMSFAFDSTETAYKLTRTSSGFGTILLKDLTVDTNVELSFDVKMMSMSSPNSQPRLGLYNGNNGVVGRLAKWGSGNTIQISTATKSADGTSISSANISSNWSEWYTLKLTFDGNSVKEELYQGNTLISSVTGTQSTLGNSNSVGIQFAYANGTIVYFKNLKVKPL